MRQATLPLTGWPMIALCAVYLLAGLLGHDPWKTADATHLGIAYEFVTGGKWLTPRIGSEPWFGAPPLYHWCAALLGKGLEGILAFHDAARLATMLFGAILLVGLATAAKALNIDAGARWTAPLLAIGTLGLLVPIHDAEPFIALIAAQSLTLLGLAMIPRRCLAGGCIAGISLAIGMLAAGANALLFLAPLPVLVLSHPHWRSRAALLGLALAMLLAIAITGLALLLFDTQSPAWLAGWLKNESAGLSMRKFEWAAIQRHIGLLGWAAWPVLPLGLWAVWRQQRQLATPAVFLPLMAASLSMLQIVLFAEPQPLQHLPLIAPLALLASSGIPQLRRGAANAFDWFGIMTFTLIAGLVWLGGWAMATGEPARVAKNFYKAEPGFVGQFSWPAFAFAGMLTLIWIWLLFRLPKSPWRAPTRWACGTILMWGLIAALWMPWIDYGKSYRPVAASLRKKLGNDHGCVVARGVGDGQRASLRYFIGLDTRAKPDARCPWLLVQGGRSEPSLSGWRKTWEGHRPGDRSERLRLYRRD